MLIRLRGANAGGYCHTSASQDSADGFEFKVWFADDMTPRPEWRWQHNFRESLVIRHFCLLSCWCTLDPSQLPRRRKVRVFWNLLGTPVNLVETRSGAMQLQPASLIVTPAQWKGIPLSQRVCVVEGVDYCKQEPWPVDILGPPPPTDPSFFNAPTCGLRCNGPSSRTCPGAARTPGCKCVMSDTPILHLLGFDLVAGPVALCINMAVVVSLLAKQGSSSSSLHGRDVDQQPLLDLSCPCNQTYVSKACCESDGLVWEAADLKLGQLGDDGELRVLKGL